MERLTYKAVARKSVNHISDGVIYIHSFGTGFQELVFVNHAAAARFANQTGCELSAPKDGRD
jgi:hypothetical protein